MNQLATQDTLFDKLDGARWHGRYFLAKCPFHDDSKPSLLVFPDGAICLGCHRRATLEQVYHRVQNSRREEPKDSGIPRLDLVHWRNMPPLDELAEEAHAFLVDYPEQQDYLRRRGVTEVIDDCTLGWWMGWYTLPVYDEHRIIQGIVLRASPDMEAKTGVRFLVPPGQPPLLYVPDWGLVRRAERAHIVYGMFDALTLRKLRLPVMTVTHGNERTHPAHYERFRIPLEVTPDKNEEQEARLLVSGLGWRGKLRLLDYPPGAKDPNDFSRLGKEADLQRQLA